MSDLSERAIRPAMTNIINYMSNDVATKMYQSTYNWAGTAGQTINSFSDFLQGVQRMNEMAASIDVMFSIL
jgi:hypothetical protein